MIMPEGLNFIGRFYIKNQFRINMKFIFYEVDGANGFYKKISYRMIDKDGTKW